MSLDAKQKMEMAIWNHGRSKAIITECINKLKRTTISDHPDIIKAIDTLEKEKLRLSKVQIF